MFSTSCFVFIYTVRVSNVQAAYKKMAEKNSPGTSDAQEAKTAEEPKKEQN